MDNPEKLVKRGTQNTRQRQTNGQSRETGKMGYTKHKTKINQWTIQRNWSNGVHKTQDKDKPMDNLEKLVKWGTQNTRQR